VVPLPRGVWCDAEPWLWVAAAVPHAATATPARTASAAARNAPGRLALVELVKGVSYWWALMAR
jgi:hypothetical protein